jgi:hypothetical protein
VNVQILFQDDKGKMVPIRGSPYKASFNASTPVSANNLTGPTLTKHITKTIESTQNWMKETAAGATVKDKDISDVKVLIGIKDNVDEIQAKNDQITLKLDQLDESLRLLQSHQMAKESQIKQTKKLFDEWNHTKKVAKENKKEITPLVAAET